MASEDTDLACCGAKFSLYILAIIGLVCFAGLMAGLTLGLMSLGLVDLEVLMKSGPPRERVYAGTLYLFLDDCTVSLLHICSFLSLSCDDSVSGLSAD